MSKKLTIFIIIIALTPLSASINIADEIKNNDFPSYFSWQNINGIDYTTPIRDQSPAPTCEAYALCASLETLIKYQIDETFTPDLSETHLYFYAGGTYEAGYVNLVDAANYLIDYGVPDEGCYPDPHRAFDYHFESLEDWQNRTVRIMDWGWVEKTEESMKRALMDYGPLIFCAYFWQDFYYYKNGVYKHRWGELAGGHVMTIVGFDDEEQCWIARNSWGAEWGNNGWFKMAYDADMFAEWYGENTGVMYIDGVYGNINSDVPKINIETPKNFQTYIMGIEIPIIFKKLPIQIASPRIFGKLQIVVDTENTNRVEFYIDNEKLFTSYEEPHIWDLYATPGLHILEVRAFNNFTKSIDIVDIYLFK